MKLRKALLTLACAVVVFHCGFFAGRERLPTVVPKNHPQGRVTAGADPSDAQNVDPSMSSAFTSLPYVQGVHPATQQSGVVVFDRERAYDGFNLYTTFVRRPESLGFELEEDIPEAHLMDMDGKTLHKWISWHPDLLAAARNDSGDDWYHVHLYENGDLLLSWDSAGLIKIDKDSNLIWRYPVFAHHDLDVTEDGRIYALTTARLRKVPDLDLPVEQFVDECVSELSAEGKVLRVVSIFDALRGSAYSSILSRVRDVDNIGWLFHTNSIEVLDGSLEAHSSAFKSGNLLVSARNVDALFVIDPEKKQVVWALSGMWKGQHQPTWLRNGNILLFDNLGHLVGSSAFSKVIEFNPLTQDIVWRYDGGPGNGFLSVIRGGAQRLTNGNTLIMQSESGRAFEVTRDNQIVWEFRNPARVGKHDENVAALVSMQRLEADFPLDWLAGRR